MKAALLIGGSSVVAPYNPKDYDIYCVINLGIVEVGEAGCDIWFSGLNHNHHYCKGEGKKWKKMVRTSVEDNLRFEYPKEWNSRVEFANTRAYKLLRDRVGRPKKPTTGLAAINELLVRGYEVYTTGFDFYTTPNRFTKGGVWKAHDLEKEKEIYEGWMDKGQVVELPCPSYT